MTDKRKLATKLRTKKEELNKTPVFQTKAWESRKEAIKMRVKNTEARMKKASLKAKERKNLLIK